MEYITFTLVFVVGAFLSGLFTYIINEASWKEHVIGLEARARAAEDMRDHEREMHKTWKEVACTWRNRYFARLPKQDPKTGRFIKK